MRWTKREGLTGMGGLPNGVALGVSRDASVVVGWSEFGDGVTRPFYWTADSEMQPLPGLPGSDGWCVASGVSADGSVIVGECQRSSPSPEAVRWTNTGAPVPLGPITSGADLSRALGISADGSVIVGELYNDSHAQAFMWTQEDGVSLLGSLPGDTESSHPVVSGDGSTIVGLSSHLNAITNEGFLWRQDIGMVPLAPRPDGIGQIEPRAVSFDGSVVVGILIEEDPWFFVHPFIFSAAGGLRDLEDVLVNDWGIKEVADWHLGYATGISADGRVIVGWGVNPSGDSEAWIVRLSGRYWHIFKE